MIEKINVATNVAQGALHSDKKSMPQNKIAKKKSKNILNADKFENSKSNTNNQNNGLISTIKKPFIKVRGLLESAITEMGGPNEVLSKPKNRFLNPVLYYVSKGMKS